MGTEDTKVKTQTKVGVTSYEPIMWKVIFHNDEITPMQFVTQCLIEIFHKTEEQAVTLVKSIHDQGKGIAGIYPYDIAETKSLETTEVARSNNYPLKVSIEKE
jgi:ATP-dependent Clp protease adaptor protein ClpS